MILMYDKLIVLYLYFFVGEGRQNTLDPGMNDFEDADKITISVSKLI